MTGQDGDTLVVGTTKLMGDVVGVGVNGNSSPPSPPARCEARAVKFACHEGNRSMQNIFTVAAYEAR